MKKILAVLLALVMACSCMVLAFAEDDTTTTTTAAAEENNALMIDKGSFFDMTATDIIDALISVFDTHAEWWDAIEDIIIRLIDFVNNIGIGVPQADVAGAISDLEAKIATLPIVGDILTTIHNLITSLKQKIKDLYAGNKETEAVEETDAAPTADTGSSSMGIVVFAAVSVAAAAAYVCTKKKAA